MIMHPWQHKMYMNMVSGGYKPGELYTISAGRQTGKSMYYNQSLYSDYQKYFNKSYSKKHWPYQYEIDLDSIIEAERWCWDRFPGRYWNSDRCNFVFKREKDAVLFALKWA